MDIDLDRLDGQERYKLLTGLVVPRPIAWVSTLTSSGGVNVAPYSFFNAVCSDPAIVVIGVGARDDASDKDTKANILRDGTFVVHIVDHAHGQAMNLSAYDFPPEESETDAVDLATEPSSRIPVPRLATAPVAMECRLYHSMDLAPDRTMIMGEVVAIHVRDGIVEPDRLRTDPAALDAIGRLAGSSYCTTRERFELVRPAERPA